MLATLALSLLLAALANPEADQALTTRMRALGYGKTVTIPEKHRARVDSALSREGLKLEDGKLTSGQLQIILGDTATFHDTFKLPADASRAEVDELSELILAAKDPTEAPPAKAETQLAMPGLPTIPANADASRLLRRMANTLPDKATVLPPHLKQIASKSMRGMGMRDWAEVIDGGGNVPPEVMRMWYNKQRLPREQARAILQFVQSQQG